MHQKSLVLLKTSQRAAFTCLGLLAVSSSTSWLQAAESHVVLSTPPNGEPTLTLEIPSQPKSKNAKAEKRKRPKSCRQWIASAVCNIACFGCLPFDRCGRRCARPTAKNHYAAGTVRAVCAICIWQATYLTWLFTWSPRYQLGDR